MAEGILVSAAASLTDAFNEIGKSFARTKGDRPVRFNFGASGALVRQIMAGAPADVFASAAVKEMDDLEKAGRIDVKTRVDFVSNQVVLIVPKSSRLTGWNDLSGNTVRRIAIGNPDSVPAGRYAKETLTKRGLWASLQGRLVNAENVRQALAYVASGDAEAGVVFATDAQIEAKRIRVIATAVPGKDHTPIRYPVAVLKDTRHPDLARHFVTYLRSPEAQAILKKYGFRPPGGKG